MLFGFIRFQQRMTVPRSNAPPPPSLPALNRSEHNKNSTRPGAQVKNRMLVDGGPRATGGKTIVDAKKADNKKCC